MRKVLFFSLLVVVIGIGLLHFFTPGHLLFYHNTYRRLSYFPIVLGGIWFGVRGGLTMAVLSSIFFIPHLLLYMGKGLESYLSEMTEILLYLAAGLVTGVISGRQTRLREKYRQLSEKLQKSYARLHEETEQLIEVETQLAAAQRMSALGKLSASMAHEIKNPLSSIRGTAEILLDEFPADHPKREFADILLKETGRLTDTVEEILRFSRTRANESRLAREPLSAVISHVTSLLDRRLRDKGIRLRLPAEADVPVEGGKISQVFMNLMLNAIDAVPEGGEIAVRMNRSDRELFFSVCDNGPGVAEEDRERIFAPFYTNKEEGTGLGLLISRKIVESCGGTLAVRDRQGGGACFEVRLPAERDAFFTAADNQTLSGNGDHAATNSSH